MHIINPVVRSGADHRGRISGTLRRRGWADPHGRFFSDALRQAGEERLRRQIYDMGCSLKIACGSTTKLCGLQVDRLGHLSGHPRPGDAVRAAATELLNRRKGGSEVQGDRHDRRRDDRVGYMGVVWPTCSHRTRRRRPHWIQRRLHLPPKERLRGHASGNDVESSGRLSISNSACHASGHQAGLLLLCDHQAAGTSSVRHTGPSSVHELQQWSRHQRKVL